MKSLIINPGSTSTKVALYENADTVIVSLNIKHSYEQLKKYDDLKDQYLMRKESIVEALHEKGILLKGIDVVFGRGGLLRPIPSGIYEISEQMLTDLKEGKRGVHASNLGGLIAHDLALEMGVKSYIMDPVIVDELNDLARYSGHPNFQRKSIFHALSHKSVARRFAKESMSEYEKLNLIVAHLGGGITVGAHHLGKVVDVNNGLDGDGPFSPERSGSLPVGQVIDACFSGNYVKEQLKKMVTGGGGLVAYLETTDAREIENRIENSDHKAKEVYEAMAYQVSKEIGSMATVLKGQVDQIIITGGLAYSSLVIDFIKSHCSFIAPVTIYPGENEMQALAQGAYELMCLNRPHLTYP